MSAEKIAELKRCQAEVERLQAEIAVEKPKMLAEFVEGIRQHCAEHDFAVAEVAAMLKQPKKDRRSQVRHWRHKKDRSLVYGGRGVPKWMREDMTAKGMDPADKQQRDQYRAEWMEAA